MTKKVIVSVLFAAFCLAGCKPSATNPEVTVTEAVYGCEDKQIIRITMQGGRAKYAICIVPTDPLMEPGQEFLIFANKNEDGTYSILNGEEGRFLYEDGLLTALQYTDLPEKPGNGFDIKEKPFDEMLQELQSALSE